MRAPRDGGRRRGARRGARAHVVSAQGGSSFWGGSGNDVCTDLSGSNTVSASSCEDRRKLKTAGFESGGVKA